MGIRSVETEIGPAYSWIGEDDVEYYAFLDQVECGGCEVPIESPSVDNLSPFGYIGMDDQYREAGFWTCDTCLKEEGGEG